MSISFVRAKAISRGSGQSAVACSAYRACQRIVNEETKKVFNYTKKEGLIAEGLQCPNGVKMNRHKLWNLVEKTEKRKDSRLAKEFIIALPYELEIPEQIEIAKKIAIQLSTGDRFADWAIHEPSKKGDDRNIHAHFMITERNWNRETGTFETKKNRDWNTEEYLQKQKIEIAKICNIILKERNFPEIDPRRYIEKLEAGLDVAEPQKHKGVVKTNHKRNQIEKLERIQKEISKLEGLGYGNTGRDTGLDRPIDRRSVSNKKEHDSELGGNIKYQNPADRSDGNSSNRNKGFGIGD